MDFVGSLSNGSAALADREHEGHSGWRIDQISASVAGWMNTYRPDIVLLMIGTNDMVQGYQLSTAPNRLSALIDQITGTLPTSHVIVASIPRVVGTPDFERVQAYDATIPGIVDAKVADGKHVSYADIYGVIGPDDLHTDNTHINARREHEDGQCLVSGHPIGSGATTTGRHHTADRGVHRTDRRRNRSRYPVQRNGDLQRADRPNDAGSVDVRVAQWLRCGAHRRRYLRRRNADSNVGSERSSGHGCVVHGEGQRRFERSRIKDTNGNTLASDTDVWAFTTASRHRAARLHQRRRATSATVAPSNVRVRNTVQLGIVVTSAVARSALVDLEVYGPTGIKVFQKAWDGQSLAAGQQRSYTASWSVPSNAAAGRYVVRVGVFKPGWGSLYHWNASAAQITVSR